MRTRVLIHLISGDSQTPIEDMIRVNNELILFDPALGQKPQIVAVNKIDIPEVKEVLDIIKSDFNNAGIKPHFISAETGEGVKTLMTDALKALKQETVKELPVEAPEKVFRPRPRQPRITVEREGDEFVIHAPGLDRMYTGQGGTSHELRWQLNLQLAKYGVNKALQKAGVRPGDNHAAISL